jgi:hypothetical protein
MRIMANGNVGIGITNPNYKLEVLGPAGFRNGSFHIGTETGSNTGAIEFYVPVADPNTLRIYRNVGAFGGTYSAELAALELYSGGAYNTRISGSGNSFLNGGNVGIGTASPVNNLHVQGTTSIIRVQSTSANANASIWFNSNVGGTPANRWEIGTNISAGGDLEFYDRLNGASRMVIEPSGNVGIGTINPPADGLTIRREGSDKRTLLQLDRPNTPGLQTNIKFSVANIMVGQIQHEYASSNYNHMSFTLRDPGGADVIPLWLQNSGNVGIGTNNPALKLHVNTAGGTVVRFQSSYGYMGMGPANTSYAHHNTDRPAYYFPVNCQASGGFSTYSDSRLKENVEPVTGALDKVAIMNGVTFTWDNSKKSYGPEGKQFGVLAQNMLEVDSDLPSLREDALESQENIDNADIDTQYYTMDYSRLTPFFIEAIKELKTKLEAAEARIAVLEG